MSNDAPHWAVLREIAREIRRMRDGSDPIAMVGDYEMCAMVDWECEVDRIADELEADWRKASSRRNTSIWKMFRGRIA